MIFLEQLSGLLLLSNKSPIMLTKINNVYLKALHSTLHISYPKARSPSALEGYKMALVPITFPTYMTTEMYKVSLQKGDLSS